ncbi:MAG: hypothetical protein ABSC02_07235 [Acidobacteriota bacterium]|jgi:hypothetical protein
MKHLKSSLLDLREIFEHSLAARDLAEPLASFDDSQAVEIVRAFMEMEDFDVVGVRHSGRIVGYAERSALLCGVLSDHLLVFKKAVVFSDVAPIVEVLRCLVDTPQVFVCTKDHVWGIITRGDLQKAPMRMCLFGLISLLEMQLLRLIRDMYPGGTWRSMLSAPRIDSAEKILSDRRCRNEGTDLADCLQFADKRTIIAKSEGLRVRLGFESCSKAESLLKDLEKLRDDLAHSQDILAGRWPGIVELAKMAETLLERCEGVDAISEKPA